MVSNVAPSRSLQGIADESVSLNRFVIVGADVTLNRAEYPKFLMAYQTLPPEESFAAGLL